MIIQLSIEDIVHCFNLLPTETGCFLYLTYGEYDNSVVKRLILMGIYAGLISTNRGQWANI